jgi:hypothetical protein
MTLEVLGFQLNSTECGTGVCPVPVVVNVAGEFVALLTNERVPLATPVSEGANVTATVREAPDATMKGNVAATLYPLPVTLAAVTETEPEPVLERDTFCVLVAPTSTEPKFNDGAERFSKKVNCATPVPLRDTVGAAVEELLVTLMVPVIVADVAGANTTLPTALALGARVSGKMNPLTE